MAPQHGSRCSYYHLRREQLLLFPIPVNLMITSMSFGIFAIVRFAEQQKYIESNKLAQKGSNRDLYIVCAINIITCMLTNCTFLPAIFLALFRPWHRVTAKKTVRLWQTTAIITAVVALGNAAGLTYVALTGWTDLGTFRSIDLEHLLEEAGQVGQEYWMEPKVRSAMGLAWAGFVMISACATILFFSLNRQRKEAISEEGVKEVRESMETVVEK